MLHTCFPAGYLHPVATVRGVALCLSYPPPPSIDFFYRISQLLCRFVLCGFQLSFGLGEPHATIHRALADLLADAIVGRVSHGTAHLPSSQRYYLTAKGIGEAARVLGFETPSDFVRAYHVSREWLALLIRRMDVVAAVYRLAASLSPGAGFGRTWSSTAGAASTAPSPSTTAAASAWCVTGHSLALRRRSLYDRLRAIAGYDYTRRPDAVLVLTPSVWELRLTTRFCINLNPDDCFVAVETRDALERRAPAQVPRSPGNTVSGNPSHILCPQGKGVPAGGGGIALCRAGIMRSGNARAFRETGGVRQCFRAWPSGTPPGAR